MKRGDALMSMLLPIAMMGGDMLPFNPKAFTQNKRIDVKNIEAEYQKMIEHPEAFDRWQRAFLRKEYKKITKTYENK